jgi:hypothetical protein
MITSAMMKFFTGGRRPVYWGMAGFGLTAVLAVLAGCAAPRVHRPVTTEPFWPHIFVSGDFNNPGYCPWTNGMTLSDAIDLAGGFFPGAERTLYVRHPDGTSAKYKLTIEYRCTNNVVLQRNDDVINLDQGGS